MAVHHSDLLTQPSRPRQHACMLVQSAAIQWTARGPLTPTIANWHVPLTKKQRNRARSGGVRGASAAPRRPPQAAPVDAACCTALPCHEPPPTPLQTSRVYPAGVLRSSSVKLAVSVYARRNYLYEAPAPRVRRTVAEQNASRVPCPARSGIDTRRCLCCLWGAQAPLRDPQQNPGCTLEVP